MDSVNYIMPFGSVVRFLKTLNMKDYLTACAFFLNLIAVLMVGWMAYWASERANEINQGQNTLELLVGLNSSKVRNSRKEIANLIEDQNNAGAKKFDISDFHQQNELIRGPFNPFLQQADLLAYCVETRLCNADLVEKYSCGTIDEIFGQLDRILDLLPIKPSEESKPLATLVKKCGEVR